MEMTKENLQEKAEQLEIYLGYLADEVGKKKVNQFLKAPRTYLPKTPKVQHYLGMIQILTEEIGTFEILFDGEEFSINI